MTGLKSSVSEGHDDSTETPFSCLPVLFSKNLSDLSLN